MKNINKKSDKFQLKLKTKRVPIERVKPKLNVHFFILIQILQFELKTSKLGTHNSKHHLLVISKICVFSKIAHLKLIKIMISFVKV